MLLKENKLNSAMPGQLLEPFSFFDPTSHSIIVLRQNLNTALSLTLLSLAQRSGVINPAESLSAYSSAL